MKLEFFPSMLSYLHYFQSLLFMIHEGFEVTNMLTINKVRILECFIFQKQASHYLNCKIALRLENHEEQKADLMVD